jgi:myotubularin-related protein 6/7/8
MDREMQRQRVPDELWRATDINIAYEFCPSYPGRFYVPATISDATLRASGKFRRNARVPALSYWNKRTGTALVRTSQPTSGVAQQVVCEEDEACVEEIRLCAHVPHSEIIIMDARSKLAAWGNQAKGVWGRHIDVC